MLLVGCIVGRVHAVITGFKDVEECITWGTLGTALPLGFLIMIYILWILINLVKEKINYKN